MKKILAFILCLALSFTFTACEIKGKNDKQIADIKEYAIEGKIPESKYSLSQNVDELKNVLKEEYETNEDALYYFDEGKTYSLIDNGTYNFFYKNDKKADGVSYIVSYATAYGFPIGTVSLEIKDALKAYEAREEAFNDKNSFFLFGDSEGTVLKYEFDKNTVMFVFRDNGLCATAIYKTSDWK